MATTAGAAITVPAAHLTPLLSTLLLLAAGERLTSIGLIGCSLIVVYGLGVVLAAAREPGASGC